MRRLIPFRHIGHRHAAVVALIVTGVAAGGATALAVRSRTSADQPSVRGGVLAAHTEAPLAVAAPSDTPAPTPADTPAPTPADTPAPTPADTPAPTPAPTPTPAAVKQVQTPAPAPATTPAPPSIVYVDVSGNSPAQIALMRGQTLVVRIHNTTSDWSIASNSSGAPELSLAGQTNAGGTFTATFHAVADGQTYFTAESSSTGGPFQAYHPSVTVTG